VCWGGGEQRAERAERAERRLFPYSEIRSVREDNSGSSPSNWLLLMLLLEARAINEVEP